MGGESALNLYSYGYVQETLAVKVKVFEPTASQS